MTPEDCRRRMDVVYARAREKFEAQYVRAGDKLYFPGLGNVEVTSVSPPNPHAFVHMELSNGRYLDLDMYERVQRQTAVESLPSCSSCGSAPRMSAQAMQHYGRGEHGPGTSKIVDLRHHDGAISSGRVAEERGRTRDSWVVAWSSGPLSGEATLFSRVQLPGETDLGRLSLRETAESLPSRGTCGRTPKERRQAEHIAESYEDRGLDARTSKNRACATVNARRNEQMEDRGRNSVHHANIADAGLTAAWRGLTESLPTKHARGEFDPRDWSAQNIIASTMHWEPHAHLYYELLAVRPDATDSEIWSSQWRWKLVDKPDAKTHRHLRRLAFDVLSNKDWRKDYDAHGNLDVSFRGLRRRVAEATTMVHSGDVMSDVARAILPAVNDMGPEAYAAYSGRSLTELVELLKRTLHELESEDAKYRLPSKTESLPSPKHAGRKGDGFNPGEHVIRLGDMIKMEGALGGYVEGINRVAGTAKIEQDNGVLTTWPLVSLMRDTPENRDLQQEYNDKIDAEVNARLELSLAKWKAL